MADLDKTIQLVERKTEDAARGGDNGEYVALMQDVVGALKSMQQALVIISGRLIAIEKRLNEGPEEVDV
jgi:hypothetical protein